MRPRGLGPITDAFFRRPTIGRGRFRPQPKETGKRLRINTQIRISPVRLIDENDEQLGLIELDDARARAKDAGLDLVEVAPQAKPPVCRIMDYGKWKYAQKKKEQKAKAHAKQSELKGMRLRPKIDEHDLSIKLAKAREFLEDGDKVQFTMLFRGREMAHRDLGMKTMRDICDIMADCAKVESPPKMMGRRMTMVLAPDRGAKAKKDASGKSADKSTEQTAKEEEAKLHAIKQAERAKLNPPREVESEEPVSS